MTYRTFTATTHFKGLDGLRAFSVIAVIWTHVSGPHAMELLRHGNKGVDLFFAISGFLVTTLLLKERRRTGAISLRDFYIRRTLRIFPLYYAVLALYCVLVFATMRGTPKAAEFWQNLPAFATYTSNWFVSAENGAEHGVTFYFAWSLATEEQFYLFWPPVLVAALASRRAWLPAVVAVVLFLAQVAAIQVPAPGLVLTAIGSLAPPILFGAMFAVLLDHRPTFDVLAPMLGRRVVPPLATALLLAQLQLGAPALAISFTMAVLVASICLCQDSWLHPVLDARPVAFVGTISYGMYLMHMLAANAVRKVAGHQMGLDVFAGTVLLVVLMAYASHRWFESPILRLKARFTGRGRIAAARPAAAVITPTSSA
ncbi:acyltransferase [Frateuria sp.]|uniref:acyltransferase family protein n=1 Tax=Frateuria sp. TaxID=2211372 RepID=UPI0018337C1F|nr:acyltransferase [Frateuria sp.]NUR23428.1 acyltransferase [Frateuria sp.]